MRSNSSYGTHARTAKLANVGTTPDGKFVVCGGKHAHGAVLSTVECFDPRTNTWSMLPPMCSRRAGCAATALPDGQYGRSWQTPPARTPHRMATFMRVL